MCPFQNHLHISKHAGRAGFFHCTSFYEISLLNSHPLILITQVSDSLPRASSISLKSSAACQEITGSKSSDPTLQKCWMTLVFIKLCTLNWNFVLWELVIKKTTMDFPLHKVKDFYLKKNNVCVTLLKRGCSVWITQNGALGHRSLNWMSYLTGYLTPEGTMLLQLHTVLHTDGNPSIHACHLSSWYDAENLFAVSLFWLPSSE